MRLLAASVVAAVLLLPAVTGGATPPCCAHVPLGLVSWWPGNGDATDVVGGHNGTLEGTVSFAAAEVGQGFSFDNVDDIVAVPDDPTYSPGTDSFSIDAWVKSSGPEGAGGQQIVRHYECANFCPTDQANSDWDLRLVGGHAFMFLRDADQGGSDNGGQFFEGTAPVEDGTFHHIAFVRDQAGGDGRLYVDGALADDEPLNDGASGALSNIDGEDDPVTIGGGILGGQSFADPDVEFTGVIDEVGWWRTALTGADIAAIATAGPNGKCSDQVAPVSSATAPATSAAGAPITVAYTAADNAGGSGLARVILLVRTPGASGFAEATTSASSAASGTFSYTPTAGAGDYGFATSAEDMNCGREAAPADPDAVTKVAAAATTPPPAGGPPAKVVPITQLATLPSPHVCVSRRHFPIHLKGVKGIVKAVIKLTGVPARTVKGKALGLPIDLRGLPKGKVVVRITVTTRAGKRLVGKRTYHTCANKRIIKKKH
jgi:hypothetical protein